MIRCFIAIETSSNKLKAVAQNIRSILQEYNVRASFQDPDSLHITLKFLGEITEVKVEKVKNALSKISHEKFKIVASGVNGFPNLGRPRVIFIDVKDCLSLKILHKKVENLMLLLNFPAERREFKPHITVARVKSFSRLPNQVYNKLLGMQFEETIVIDSVKLKKSTLTPRGAIYEDLHVVKLT